MLAGKMSKFTLSYWHKPCFLSSAKCIRFSIRPLKICGLTPQKKSIDAVNLHEAQSLGPLLPSRAETSDNSTVWKFFTLSILIACGHIILGTWKGFSKPLEVEEYTSNTVLIQAQQKAKAAWSTGEAPMSRLDELMIKAQEIKKEKGFRIKTPRGVYANYYEDELGEPYLLDDFNNLWIWAGADPTRPSDDWLVRTPQGDVYNFYVDSFKQMRMQILGNEKDLKVIPHSNLGTIVAFANDNIKDVHYRQLPQKSLETTKDQLSKEIVLPPSVIDEGFLTFSNKNTQDNARYSQYAEIEESIRTKGEKFRVKHVPFLDTVDFDEEEIIASMEKEGYINGASAQEMRAKLAHEIEEERTTTLNGLDLKSLPSPNW